MKTLYPRARLHAVLAVPFLGLLGSAFACAYSFSIGPRTEDHFPAIRSRAQLSRSEPIGKLRLEVRYARGDEEAAGEAIEQARRALAFLSANIPSQAAGRAVLYFYPVHGSEQPTYFARGRGDFAEVLFRHEGQPFMESEHNREVLRGTFVHEMAHVFLHSFKLDDRWLADGIPELLAGQYEETCDSDLYSSRHWWTPPLVALRQVPLEPWDHHRVMRMVLAEKHDNDYSQYLGYQETLRYAAAEELLRRWSLAASAKGIREPLRDLLHRVRAAGRNIGWPEVQRLCLEQTGKTVAEIARVSDDEVNEARYGAWKERLAAYPGVRVRALRTLAEFGLPAKAEPSDLLPSLDCCAPRYGDWLWAVMSAGTMAVAATGDADAGLRVLEIVKSKQSDYLALTAPRLWQVLFSREPRLSLENLAAMMARDDVPLTAKEEANAILEQLTGKSAAWKPDAGPGRRTEAARRWAAVVAAGH